MRKDGFLFDPRARGHRVGTSVRCDRGYGCVARGVDVARAPRARRSTRSRRARDGTTTARARGQGDLGARLGATRLGATRARGGGGGARGGWGSRRARKRDGCVL